MPYYRETFIWATKLSPRKKGAGGGKVGVGCSRINVVLLKEEERQLYP